MIGEFANHLWQSTVFAGAAALLALACRKNEARVRYWLWLAASLKFLVPIALLVALGSRLEWAPVAQQIAPAALSSAVVQLSQPFVDLAPASDRSVSSMRSGAELFTTALCALWVSGVVAIALIRLRMWRRVRAVARASTPRHVPGIPAEIEVRSAPGLMEPGVVGVCPSILLIPAGIEDHLTPRQLEAVLAHELCHIRRHDNLTAAIHMLVETLFWFYPLVWWIGARLIQERERACDEEVLRLGGDPQVYAEGIITVCKRYAEAPLVCVSGVTGSDLKQRIVAIMKGHSGDALDASRRLLLGATALAAIAVPIALGVLQAPRLRAQVPGVTTLEFEVATIRVVPPDRRTAVRVACAAVDGSFVYEAGVITHQMGSAVPRGRCIAESASLGTLIAAAYDAPRPQVSGVEDWPDVYYLEGKAENQAAATKDDLVQMLQSLLSDRFKLRVHTETKEVEGYALLVSDDGVKFKQTSNSEQPVGPPPPGAVIGGGLLRLNGGFRLSQFANFLSARSIAGLPVLDQTNLDGMFDISFTLNPGPSRGGPNPLVSFNPPLTQALEEQLGLKLERRKVPVEVIVVDHVEKPSAN